MVSPAKFFIPLRIEDVITYKTHPKGAKDTKSVSGAPDVWVALFQDGILIIPMLKGL
jgi:hypothetical protein